MTVGPVARNTATGTFFDGTARGVFLLRRCRPSGHYNRPQAVSCTECGSTGFDDVPAGGGVRLVSWVVVPERPRDDRPPGPAAVPAIVEFDEGPWWWSKLVDADPAALTEGQPLRMLFERAEGGEAVPVFTPAAGRAG
ncbi:MAG TPA: OB-fold domain-containing protein [Acidimicrobiales bacterium]|nr:OB-fold domain-containing protein [Acidimicrobiales bacterium]